MSRARRRTAVGLLLAMLATSLSVVAREPADAATLPPGFADDTVVTGISDLVAMSWLPNGYFVTISKWGPVRLANPADGSSTLIMNLSSRVNSIGDRGLLGLATHPNFTEYPYLYLLYTYDPPETQNAAAYWDGNGGNGRSLANGMPDGQGHRANQLVRFTLDAATGYSSVVADSERILLGSMSTWDNLSDPFVDQTATDSYWACSLYGAGDAPADGSAIDDCLPSDGGSHSVGALAFGDDGNLFVSLGDAAHYLSPDPRALRALDQNHLAGKVLRIDPGTGGGVPGNPFWNGDPNANGSRVWNLGLRNPFRFAMDPISGQPYVGDVGWNLFEEINVGSPGASFGWPCFEGGLTDTEMAAGTYEGPGTSRAQFAYDNLPACAPFLAANNQTAPYWAVCHNEAAPGCLGSGRSIMAGVVYTGTNYPAQYQGLWWADFAASTLSVLNIYAPTPVSQTLSTDIVAPLHMSIGPDGNIWYVSFVGEVHRIRYTGGNNLQPVALASADTTSGPAPLAVQFTGSGSSDPEGQTLSYAWDFGDGTTSSAADPSHAYAAGSYIATLTVTDPQGGTDITTIDIVAGNTAPVPTISTPLSSTIALNSTVAPTGSATDAEDGSLAGTSLSWEALLHHNNHVHPDAWAGSGTSPAPFTFDDHDDDTWLELCLTATDSGGLSGTTCVELRPSEVDYTFATSPAGLDVVYHGQRKTTPFTVPVATGAVRTIEGLHQGSATFTSWSIGGGQTRNITIAAGDRTITANHSAGADTTPPSVPANLVGQQDGSNVNLSWEASTDNVAVREYSIWRNGNWHGWTTSTTWTDTQTSVGATYSYRVQAIDTALNWSALSPVTSVTLDNGGPDTQAPSIPGNVTAATDGTSVTLSWEASTDNVAVREYSIWRNGNWYSWTVNPGWTDNNVTPGSTYTYRVQAIDTSLNYSGQSPAQTITVEAGGPDTSPPSIPVNLTATATADGVVLDWGASTDNVAVREYSIWRNGNWYWWTVEPGWVDTNVTPGQTYTYRVQAIDTAINWSGQSAPAQATAQ